jgi:riboflavin kinase/FMN adenylyltransferase
MKIIHSLEQLTAVTDAAVLGVGFFDGVHIGHQAVLAHTRRRATELNATSWALTFEPHPQSALGRTPPPRIASPEHKLMLLERCGIDGCIVLPFTHELATQPPETFADMLVHQDSVVRAVVAGADWRYGKHGAGSTGMLARAGRETGMEVDVIGAVSENHTKVSSTRIRTAIQKGDLDGAATMLGHPFSLLGQVIHGEGIGRKLGFPSANLASGTEVLPPDGVYAVLVRIDNKLHAGALSCGHRPTFPEIGGALCVEVHLLDLDDDLYGNTMELFFISFIREQQRYNTREALIAQICDDVATTRTQLENHPRTTAVRSYLASLPPDTP